MRGAAEPLVCDWYLVRYVPNLAKDTSLNVGILLYSPETGLLWSRFAKNHDHAGNFHGQADLEFIAQLEEYFVQQIKESWDDPMVLFQIARTYSNIIRIDPPQQCTTRDHRTEIEKLPERHSTWY